MGKQPPFAGIGKLYFCRAEDIKDGKLPQLLGEAVTLKPGMLTYKDDDEKPGCNPKGYSIGFNVIKEKPNRELIDILNRPTLFDVKVERKPGRMPRKMKKALHRGRCYRRQTKWKRKLANYQSRLCHTLHNAEIVITRDQLDLSLFDGIHTIIAQKRAAGKSQTVNTEGLTDVRIHEKTCL